MANEHIITISFQERNTNSIETHGNNGKYQQFDGDPFGSESLLDTGLEKLPVDVNCSYCNYNIKTLVEKKLRKGSLFVPVMCLFFGNFFLIFLAIFMDAFREWRHYCPNCGEFLGRFIPTTSGNVLAALMMTTLFISAFEICLIFSYFNYWNDIRHYFES